MSREETEELKDINNTQIDSTGSKTDQTNNDQGEESNIEESNKQTQQSNSIFKGLGNMGSFGISDGFASGANYFTNTVVNSVTNIHDDKYIEEEFKKKILEAIKYFNTEYTKSIKGHENKDKRNKSQFIGVKEDAIKNRGKEIIRILEDTLGLFSNMDDDNFFNKLGQFIQKRENAKLIKEILVQSNNTNNEIQNLIAGLSNKDDENKSVATQKLGLHGIGGDRVPIIIPPSSGNTDKTTDNTDNKPNLGGKRIKKRTKKNKKSSKKTKTKRNRK